MLLLTVASRASPYLVRSQVIKRQLSGFSFAGPKTLNEILKTELLQDKSKTEISDIWVAYHEEKKDVHGTILNGEQGVKLLERAEKCPFFIQPVFREGGYFMLLSQYQAPSHFILAFLEDYKLDPSRAQPLFTFSIFNDFVSSHDISLQRLDVINKGIGKAEGIIVMQNIVDAYRLDEDYKYVSTFNESPERFDISEFISFMKRKWEK